MSHGSFPILKILKYMPEDLGGKTILDAGVGAGEPGFYLRQYVNRPWSKLRADSPFWLIGIDKVQENIDRLEPLGIYNQLIQADLTKFNFNILGRRPQITICLETLEHIYKDEALKLVEKLVKLSDFVLVSMPFEEVIPEKVDDMGVPEYGHKSTWSQGELEYYGFETYVEYFFNLPPKLTLLVDLIRRGLGRPVKKELIGVFSRGAQV